MTRPRLPLYLLALFASTTFFTPSAQAQGVLRFVSTSGSDTNNCLRSTPCRSLNRGVESAPDGAEVIVLDSGGYGPNVTITKSVTISAPQGVQATVATPSGNSVTVNAPSATVVLRGLTLTGLGGASGIYAQSVGTLHVESCTISGFTPVAGIYVALGADGSHILIKDTVVRNNGDGVFITTSTGGVSASIDNCRSERNVGQGFYAYNHSRVTISRSVASGNGGAGFYAESNSLGFGPITSMICEGCVASNNNYGFFVTTHPNGGGAQMWVSNSVASNNTTAGFRRNTTFTDFYSRGNNLASGNGPEGTVNTSGTITPWGSF